MADEGEMRGKKRDGGVQPWSVWSDGGPIDASGVKNENASESALGTSPH
jgi:hypothetical protein